MTPTPNHSALKVRLLILPFIYISTCITVIYTFLNWLILVQFELFLPNTFIEVFFPGILSLIALLKWIRQGVNLLELNEGGKDPRVAIFALAVFFICVPCVLAQRYIPIKTGKLTRLNKLSDIEKHKKTKYYSFDKFYVDNSLKIIKVYSKITGKHNDELHFSLYIASPMMDDSNSSREYKFPVWVGKIFSTTINNNKSANEKDSLYNRFYNKTISNYMTSFPGSYSYMERINVSEEYERYREATAQNYLSYYYNYPPIILTIKEGTYDERTGEDLPLIIFTFIAGQLLWAAGMGLSTFDEKKLKAYILHKSQKNSHTITP